MKNQTTSTKFPLLLSRVAGAALVIFLAAAVFVPVVSAKTGKFQVGSWSPATAKRNGILRVYQTYKGKVQLRTFYVPKKLSDKIVKLQPGYIVTVTFKERKKKEAKQVLADGDASKVKITSSGSGDVFDSSAGGSENPARGGGGGT